MATYTGNALWQASTQAHAALPDGRIEVLSESPLIYKVMGQKNYFKGGGAFWFDTLRNADNEILDFLRPEDTGSCMPKAQFFAMTDFPEAVQARATADEICVD
jgi:hypothetical protein